VKAGRRPHQKSLPVTSQLVRPDARTRKTTLRKMSNSEIEKPLRETASLRPPAVDTGPLVAFRWRTSDILWLLIGGKEHEICSSYVVTRSLPRLIVSFTYSNYPLFELDLACGFIK